MASILSPSKSSSSTPGQDPSVNISSSNQKKINQFAIRNGWAEELADELEVLKKKQKDLEDALEDIALVDGEQPGAIFYGESFVYFEENEELESQVQKLIEKTKTDISKVEDKLVSVKKEMEGLKQELYGQFGDSINLEAE